MATPRSSSQVHPAQNEQALFSSRPTGSPWPKGTLLVGKSCRNQCISLAMRARQRRSNSASSVSGSKDVAVHFGPSSVELRMSVRPPYMRSALPPVSAVRLHATTLDSEKQLSTDAPHAGLALSLRAHGNVHSRDTAATNECANLARGHAHADYVCNGQNEDLAVSNLARVCRHRDAAGHVVDLFPAHQTCCHHADRGSGNLPTFTSVTAVSCGYCIASINSAAPGPAPSPGNAPW